MGPGTPSPFSPLASRAFSSILQEPNPGSCKSKWLLYLSVLVATCSAERICARGKQAVTHASGTSQDAA